MLISILDRGHDGPLLARELAHQAGQAGVLVLGLPRDVAMATEGARILSLRPHSVCTMSAHPPRVGSWDERSQGGPGAATVRPE